jgi:hypothetical protein
MGDVAKKLIKMLDAIESGDVSAETVASAYRSVCNRAMMTAALVKNE